MVGNTGRKTPMIPSTSEMVPAVHSSQRTVFEACSRDAASLADSVGGEEGAERIVPVFYRPVIRSAIQRLNSGTLGLLRS